MLSSGSIMHSVVSDITQRYLLAISDLMSCYLHACICQKICPIGLHGVSSSPPFLEQNYLWRRLDMRFFMFLWDDLLTAVSAVFSFFSWLVSVQLVVLPIRGRRGIFWKKRKFWQCGLWVVQIRWPSWKSTQKWLIYASVPQMMLCPWFSYLYTALDVLCCHMPVEMSKVFTEERRVPSLDEGEWSPGKPKWSSKSLALHSHRLGGSPKTYQSQQRTAQEGSLGSSALWLCAVEHLYPSDLCSLNSHQLPVLLAVLVYSSQGCFN